MSDSGDDALTGCAIMLAVVTVVFTVIAGIASIYLSVLGGKVINYAVRAVAGWTLSRSSSKRYTAFCTITVLFLVPTAACVILLAYGLSHCSGFGQFAVVTCSSLGLTGYYAGHFGTPPDKFSWLQTAGVMRIHEQETIWRNSLRTKGLVFWHWTIARHAVEIDYWFRRTMMNLASVVTR